MTCCMYLESMYLEIQLWWDNCGNRECKLVVKMEIVYIVDPHLSCPQLSCPLDYPNSSLMISN